MDYLLIIKTINMQNLHWRAEVSIVFQVAQHNFDSHGNGWDFALFSQLAFANRLFPSSSTLESLCVVNTIAGFPSCS